MQKTSKQYPIASKMISISSKEVLPSKSVSPIRTCSQLNKQMPVGQPELIDKWQPGLIKRGQINYKTKIDLMQRMSVEQLKGKMDQLFSSRQTIS